MIIKSSQVGINVTVKNREEHSPVYLQDRVVSLNDILPRNHR